MNLAGLFARGAQLLTANIPLLIQESPARAGEALREVVGWAAAEKFIRVLPRNFRWRRPRMRSLMPRADVDKVACW